MWCVTPPVRWSFQTPLSWVAEPTENALAAYCFRCLPYPRDGDDRGHLQRRSARKRQVLRSAKEVKEVLIGISV